MVSLKVTMLVVMAGVKPGNAGWVAMATTKLHICLCIHVSQVQVSPIQRSWLKQQFYLCLLEINVKWTVRSLPGDCKIICSRPVVFSH